MGHVHQVLDRRPTARSERSTIEVILDHLDCRRRNEIEADIERNFAADATIISRRGAAVGSRGVLAETRSLDEALPSMRLRVTALVAEAQCGFVEWTARGDHVRIDGADTFLVDRGRIAYQTIFYTIRADAGA